MATLQRAHADDHLLRYSLCWRALRQQHAWLPVLATVAAKGSLKVNWRAGETWQ